MDLQQYYEAIKRRWQYMLASVIIIMSIVGVNIALSPPVPVFRAESRIFVATGTTSVGPEDVAAMATSNIVASQCIDELKLGMRPFDLLERVRAEVGGSATSRGSVVTVSALATTREEAVAVANKIVELAKDRALGLTQMSVFTQGEFVGTQMEIAKRKLEVAQSNLREFKENHRDLVVPLDFSQAKQVINDLQRDAEFANVAILENQNRINSLKHSLGRRNSKLNIDSLGASSAVVDRLQAELAAREVDLMNDRQKYTDQHPKVKQGQAIIDNIKSKLNAELKKSMEISGAPTSMEYQFLKGDVARAKTELVAAQAKKSVISRLINQAVDQLAKVPDLEVEYSKLQTEYKAAQTNYFNLRDKYDEAQLQIQIAKRELERKEGIGMIDPAVDAAETAGYKFQKTPVKLSIALLISLVVGLGIVLLLEGMDNSIRNVDQVEDRYQLPVLGVVPTLKESALKGGSTLVLRDAPGSPFAEPYRILRTNFQALASHSGTKSVVITSTLPSEGKSTTAANFAASLAESHKRVVLIDADMRNPTLHRSFGIRKEPGLSSYLAGEATLEEIIFPTSVDNLLLISAGPIPENPSRLITSSRMRDLLEKLSQQADYVVVDTPPAVAFSDAMELSSIADSIILVVGAGSKLETAHFRARTQLANAQAALVGTVLNQVQPTDVDSYRYSSRYYPKLPDHKLGGNGSKPQALPEGSSEASTDA